MKTVTRRNDRECFVLAISICLFVAANTRFIRSAAVPEPIMLKSVIAEGSATVTPEFGTSGEFGTWTVRYIVGKSGIQRGGGIRIQLPDSWHAGPRNSANRLQSSLPEDEHFVTSTTSRTGVSAQTTVESESKQALVKHAKISLDGRSERYVFVVRVRVTEEKLEKGDTISVVYGDRSHGSPGYRAAAVSTESERVLIAIDSAGDSRFQLLTPLPQIRSLPGEAVEMLFHAPSYAVRGSPEEFLISLLDKQNNPVLRSDTIRIQVLEGEIDIPKRVMLQPNRGYVRFHATPRASGAVRLRAVTEELSLEARSNPILVTTETPREFVYWGDLHSHGRYSWDGVGDDSFHYARNVTGLDFYALMSFCTC